MSQALPQPAGDPLQPVPLQDLRLLAEGRHWQVDQSLSELESLTPVRGELTAVHRGNILELNGEASTIVTLRCDRCLQHFNHPLRASNQELLWIGEPAPIPSDSMAIEGEADDSGLMEQLDPRGNFDPEHWVFEQLNLLLPIGNHCGQDCPGPATWSSDGDGIDSRWSALQGLNP